MSNVPGNEPQQPPAQPSFASMPLSDELRHALADMGYETPTPVQTAVWGPAADGRDVLVQARTGTGKTAAFGLPLVDRIVRHTKREPQVLVLCPTRELALQVSREVTKLGQHKGVTVTAIYGGAGMQPQIDAINAGTQIIVGTPGRVLDHLRRGTLKPATIRALVLDESDEMLSMGFERELTAIIDRLPEQRQTLLFSATVPPDIERIARNKLKDPELVILSGDQVGALEIDHFIYWVHQDKVGALIRIVEVEAPESAIVFCNTRDQTERVSQALVAAGHAAAWLNGDLAQADREKVMKATREGKLRFLVATDVAARGIDISHLTHVINFDFPRDAEAYVHRTGRTGRAGRTGTALALVTPQDVGALYILRLTYKIRPLERQLPSAADARTRGETDIVGALAEAFLSQPRDEASLALARRVMSHDRATELVAGLLAAQLRRDPELPARAEATRKAPLAKPQEREERKGRADNGRSRADSAPRDKRRSGRSDARDADRPAAAERSAKAPAANAQSVASKAPVAIEAEPAKPQDAAKPEPAKAPAAPPAAAKPDRAPAVAPPAVATSAAKPAAPAAARADKDGDLEDAAQGDDEGNDDNLGVGVELHVSVGRRHGARAAALKDILSAGGLDDEQLLRVRVRERYSFVEVAVDAKDAAIAILNSAKLGEHAIKAGVSARNQGD